ncbi:hypothetical protein [Nocardia brasiliensis]|uniref:hypothetical protein n=1 Tax=Nocardia brasiliensis TaxID=37326 RepID=UPI0024573907|nr:hypothetical protein [Nocardia brasiliensis]
MVIVYLPPIEYCTVANLVGARRPNRHRIRSTSLTATGALPLRPGLARSLFACRGTSRQQPEPDAADAAIPGLPRSTERTVRALETRTIATCVPAARSSPETHSPFDPMWRIEIGVLTAPSLDRRIDP